jgi:hypothetical protein
LRTFIVRSWCNRVQWLYGTKIRIKWLWPVKVTLEIIKRRLVVFCWSCDEIPLIWEKTVFRASRIEWDYSCPPPKWSVNTFKPFLANSHSTSSNIYSYMYSMTPKIIHPEKVICQVLLQVSSIEEENLWFFTLFLAVTFLLANFSHFSQQFRTQPKILFCFDTHVQILQRKSFYVLLALFET